MLWLRFPAWVQFFVSGGTWSVRAPSVALVWRLETAAWRHRESSPLQSLNSLLRYGFGTVLDFFRWLVPRWASSGPARVGGRSCENGKRSFEEFHRVQESQAMFKREGAPRERARALARRFKLSVFWTSPTGGWSNQSVGTGRSPACTAALARHFHVTKRITFDPCIKTLTRFTHL